jgi:ribonuclease P protein component
MRREFRLTSSADIRRVRRTGKTYAHPLVLLIARPNERPVTRFAVAVGKAVGGAVRRNRAKRLIRQVLREHRDQIAQGWDLIVIARAPEAAQCLETVRGAVLSLLDRARLLTKER